MVGQFVLIKWTSAGDDGPLTPVGRTVGVLVGGTGAPVGWSMGATEGCVVGLPVGGCVGLALGAGEGLPVGLALGAEEGWCVGDAEGEAVGLLLGVSVGTWVRVLGEG